MRIDILTLFPNMFAGPLDESIIARARQNGRVEILIHDLRPFGLGRHRVVDDTPYGGGAGMVARPEPLDAAFREILGAPDQPREARVIFLSPQGQRLDHARAKALASEHNWLVLLCGHYEGVDQRIRDLWIDEEISIGDYVLTGGELPAMVLLDAVVRLLPGVLGNEQSAQHDSFATGLLDYPQYTRPEEFAGMRVPEILFSGHHAEIEKWRRRQALLRTLRLRPDLLESAALDEADRAFLRECGSEPGKADQKEENPGQPEQGGHKRTN